VINYEAFRYSEQLLRREYGEVAEALAKWKRIGRLHAIRGFAVPW
jgi:hypothetical protein